MSINFQQNTKDSAAALNLNDTFKALEVSKLVHLSLNNIQHNLILHIQSPSCIYNHFEQLWNLEAILIFIFLSYILTHSHI